MSKSMTLNDSSCNRQILNYFKDSKISEKSTSIKLLLTRFEDLLDEHEPYVELGPTTKKIKTIDPHALIGMHMLSGVDRFSTSHNTTLSNRMAECFRFCLDGITYAAMEDPSDGYRSSMECLYTDGESINMSFAAVSVLLIKKQQGQYSKGDSVFQMIDVLNGNVVLEFGTENSDDYYPSFVASWKPENLYINKGK